MRIPTIEVMHNWRNEKNKSDLYSIHLRITINRKQRYYKIPLPKKVSPSQWNGKEDNWVKNHPFSFEINNKIIEKKTVVNDLIRRTYNYNKTLSFDIVSKHLKRRGNSDSFYDYMKEYIKSPPEKLELNTIKNTIPAFHIFKRLKRTFPFLILTMFLSEISTNSCRLI